jgi:hypothetical protein
MNNACDRRAAAFDGNAPAAAQLGQARYGITTSFPEARPLSMKACASRI